MRWFGIHFHDWGYRDEGHTMTRQCDRCGQVEDYDLTDAEIEEFYQGEDS